MPMHVKHMNCAALVDLLPLRMHQVPRQDRDNLDVCRTVCWRDWTRVIVYNRVQPFLHSAYLEE